MIKDKNYFWMKTTVFLLWIPVVFLGNKDFRFQLISLQFLVILFELMVLFPVFKEEKKESK
jgi:hypothetical protein